MSTLVDQAELAVAIRMPTAFITVKLQGGSVVLRVTMPAKYVHVLQTEVSAGKIKTLAGLKVIGVSDRHSCALLYGCIAAMCYHFDWQMLYGLQVESVSTTLPPTAAPTTTLSPTYRPTAAPTCVMRMHA